MLKNKYEIIDQEIHLYLDRRNNESIITIVNIDVFSNIENENVKWCAKWDEDIQSFYAQASKYLGIFDGKPKYKTLYLHKFVLDYEGRNKVDHINHDTLNNKRCNLRILLDGENSINRTGANKNNSTGVRNVSFHDGKYIVQLQVNKKNTVFGRFNTLEEASLCAKVNRERLYIIKGDRLR